MKSLPLPGRLLVVIAHPDDESFLVSGSLWANRRSGGTATVICATNGERGTSHLRRPMTRPALRRLRQRELRAVCRILDVKRLITPGYPDGRLDRHTTGLARRIRSAIRRDRPDMIMSFGPDGITGHRDHIAAYQVARAAAREFRLPLFRFAHPPAILNRSMNWMFGRRSQGSYRRTVHFSRPTIRQAIDRRMKLRCLREHRSQHDRGIPMNNFPRYAADAYLAAEYFTGPTP